MTNQNQYKTTQLWACIFRSALEKIRSLPTEKGEEFRRQLEISALEAQISELVAELEQNNPMGV